MKVGRGTTSTFNQPETLVVLRCVGRLIDQGYEPAEIELEKTYRVGTSPRYLDIIVTRDGAPYMMIECKTPGAEYDAEIIRLNTDGGQVLTYFAQDRDAHWLVVYTCEIDAVGTVSESYVGLNAAALYGSNVSDLFDSWDRETFQTALFSSSPYTLKQPSLRVADLEDMQQADGQRIFNAFEEILRRHVVSDKPNAFNKIFNLFICKIFDEQKVDPAADLEFQWRQAESAQDVLSRLTDLYKRGMQEFLKLNVTDHSDAELNLLLDSTTEQSRRRIRQAFTELRLYKTNEFAFLDVFDRKTFELNSAIVRDVVRLLQKKKLRYSHKQPFMGDFFERLLATSVKQESGQFFTPLPIARFMLEALPVESMIDERIRSDRTDFLPYLIDYASGSGHFLTEAMDRVDRVLQQIDPEDVRLGRRQQRTNLANWKREYSWAETFVYGLERDYRLAKTAKVSCFLNGDGEANVIRASGLDNFTRSDDYRRAGGILSKSDEGKDNPVFDIVVANPPYSVQEFKKTVPHGAESFELWDRLGASSKEIELLFMERTKQLLKPGGVAGLVLPSSVLQADGAAETARMNLLRHFEVLAVVGLGPSTFMKTGIGTVILFLRRRADAEHENARAAARRIVDGRMHARDEDLADDYAASILGSSRKEMIEAFGDPDSSSILLLEEEAAAFATSGSWKDRQKKADFKKGDLAKRHAIEVAERRSYILDRQSERLEALALVRKRSAIAVVPPIAKKAEQRFLGYTFSDRRGRAGMQYLSGEDQIDTPLFSPVDSDDPDKIATVIRRVYETGTISIPKSLAAFCHVLEPADLIDIEAARFKTTIRSAPRKAIRPFSVSATKLGALCDLSIGATPSRADPRNFNGGTVPWLTISEMKGLPVGSTKEMITAAAAAKLRGKLVQAGTTLVSFKLSVGKTARALVPMYTNEAIAALTIKPERTNVVTDDYLFAIFTLFGPELLGVGGSGKMKIGEMLNKESLHAVRIPVLAEKKMSDFVKLFQADGEKAREKLDALIFKSA